MDRVASCRVGIRRIVDSAAITRTVHRMRRNTDLDGQLNTGSGKISITFAYLSGHLTLAEAQNLGSVRGVSAIRLAGDAGPE